MENLARRLAQWATDYEPTPEDLRLAERSLIDTVSVALAARDEPILDVVAELPAAARWATAAHIIDFDDLHLPSTTHISTVCIPAALATGSAAHGYLVGAGVMARLGTALGNAHYTRGWHNTATAGPAAAAAIAAHALGLNVEQTARAIALAVSSAGGVQSAFGSDAKSLQVGLATDSGLRAAVLTERGADAAVGALDQWVTLVGGDPAHSWDQAPAIPGGLAVKLYPCCYALQRPIGAVSGLVGHDGRGDRSSSAGSGDAIRHVTVSTPRSTVTPLIYHRPQTGLEGKFSLEYAVATAVLDSYSGFDAFTDAAVRRPEAQQLMQEVEVRTAAAGEGLLAGAVEVTIETAEGSRTACLQAPPGCPENPASAAQLDAKFDACLAGLSITRNDITWESAAALLDSLWGAAGESTRARRRGWSNG